MSAKFIECKTTAISSATTTHVATEKRGLFVHTVVCPKATSGTVTFQDLTGTPVTYFVLPIGSIGSFLIDSVFPNGLDVVTSAGDTVLINWQQS